MTATALDLDLSLLTEAEFRAEIPCEHTQHGRFELAGTDEPAEWFQHSVCPGCSKEAWITLCDPCLRDMKQARTLRDPYLGSGCGQWFPRDDWVLIWTPIPEGQRL